MEVERTGICKDNVEITKDEQISYLKKEISVYQASALKAIERNCMVGEDFRAQALSNYNIILKHREEIKELNVLPDKLKRSIFEIKTYYQRKVRNFELKLEDNQSSFLTMHQKIESLQSKIKELESILWERERILTVLQNKFGRELILVDQESQTKFKRKHRGV